MWSALYPPRKRSGFTARWIKNAGVMGIGDSGSPIIVTTSADKYKMVGVFGFPSSLINKIETPIRLAVLQSWMCDLDDENGLLGPQKTKKHRKLESKNIIQENALVQKYLQDLVDALKERLVALKLEFAESPSASNSSLSSSSIDLVQQETILRGEIAALKAQQAEAVIDD